MADRREWRCAGCEVTVRYAAGHTAKRPAGWAEDRGEWRCLSCRREHTVEQALAAAGLDAADFDARRLRRDALIRFEITRDPAQRNALVARVAATSPHHVAEQRRAMVEAGEVEALRPGRKPAAVPTKSRRCLRCKATVEPPAKVCPACKAAEQAPVERPCAQCGDTFTVGDARQMYCSDRCRWRAADAQKRARRESPRTAARGSAS